MSDNITKRVGLGTAYGFAKAGGYEGTVAEFTELLGNIAIDLARIENLSVTVTTLPAGSQATASLNGSVLSLGIPKGDKGDKGNTGETGAPAGFGTVSATVDDTIGTPSVEVTASGADTAKNFAFAFHNLKGQKGDKGDTGEVSQAEFDAAISDLRSELTDETNARILLAGRMTTAEGDIDTLETHKVAQPLDEYNQPTDGTNGQLLRTKGDGSTEWVDEGLPTDEQTALAVSAWLDEHPEATTTLEDGAITEAKLNASLSGDLIIFVSSLAELTAAITNGEKIIAFKEGTSIEVSATISIPTGTTIIGNGVTFTRVTGFEGLMVYADGNCNISNFHFDGNRTAMVSPAWDKTIEIALNGFCNLSDCVFEHGNECVIAYGDNNRIEHCKFTDCGGNAIHFSGGRYTVVDGCHVSGANKRSGMGHENGCIIWSSECAYATCVNNYCEDGISGFGRIGSDHAGYVRIIGNVVKNCTNACIVGNTAAGTIPASTILIANNTFIDSGSVKLYKSANQGTDLGRNSVVSNVLVNTWIHADRMSNLQISSNNMRGSVGIDLERCTSSIVANNVINNTRNEVQVLCAYVCFGLNLIGNYARGGKEAMFVNSSQNINIESNIVSSYTTENTDLACSVPTNAIFKNNIVRTFNKGIDVGTDCQVIGNQFWLVNDVKAIRTWGGTGKCIVALNMTNKTNSLANSESAIYDNNLEGVTESVFASVTLNLTNVTSDSFSKVVLGDDFICTLTAADGYTLPDTITVVVDGVTIPASEFIYDKTTGKVEVYGVRGAVTLTASGVSA